MRISRGQAEGGLTWFVNIGNEDPSRIRRNDMAATADEA